MHRMNYRLNYNVFDVSMYSICDLLLIFLWTCWMKCVFWPISKMDVNNLVTSMSKNQYQYKYKYLHQTTSFSQVMKGFACRQMLLSHNEFCSCCVCGDCCVSCVCCACLECVRCCLFVMSDIFVDHDHAFSYCFCEFYPF